MEHNHQLHLGIFLEDGCTLNLDEGAYAGVGELVGAAMVGLDDPAGGDGGTDVSFASRTPEALWAWLDYKAAGPEPEPPEPGGDYVTREEFEALKADYAKHMHGTPI